MYVQPRELIFLTATNSLRGVHLLAVLGYRVARLMYSYYLYVYLSVRSHHHHHHHFLNNAVDKTQP